jgi:carbon starvation protein CstA
MSQDDCLFLHIAYRIPLLFCVKAGVRYMKIRIEEIEIRSKTCYSYKNLSHFTHPFFPVIFIWILCTAIEL